MSYTLPSGTTAVPGQKILSARYNAAMNSIAAALNLRRESDELQPSQYGGTGIDASQLLGVPEVYSGAWTFPKLSLSILATGATGGVDDTTAILNAISAVKGAGGGRVILPPGTWYATHVPLQTGVELVGCGMGVSILKQVSSTVDPLIDLGAEDSVGARDLTADGNGNSQSQTGVNAGIAALGATNVLLQNVQTVNTADWGFGLYEISGATLLNCRAQSMRVGVSPSAVRGGFLLGSSSGGTDATDVHLIGCRAESSALLVDGFLFERGSDIRATLCRSEVGYTGFKIKTDHTILSQCKAYGGVQGFQTQAAIQALILLGNQAHFAGDSGFMFSVPSGTARDWVLSGNIAFDNGQAPVATSYGFAFELAVSAILDRLSLTNNIATSQGRGFSFAASGTITNALIANNLASGNTADWVNAGSLDLPTLTLGPNTGTTGASDDFSVSSVSQTLQFTQDNIAQNGTGTMGNGTGTRGFLMTRSGYLRAVHAKSSDPVTAGQVVFQILKNGVPLGNPCAVTTGTFTSRIETPFEQVFDEGDLLTCIYAANGSLLPTGTADFDVVAEVVKA